MSDKRKLSYYFLKKPDNLVQESNSTPQRTTTSSEIVNINETIVLTEFLDASSPLSSSTSLILHDQSGIYENSSTTTATTPKTKSNLLELLELRSLDNDFIKSKLKSLQYTHHSIQNELLYLIQENILSQIVFQIKSAKYFSIMMDESVDISRHEQVSLVIRYTDDQFHVYERFIGFQRASSTTGEALFKLLVTWLKQLDLDINNIVGQCFDGASAMRGIYKGVSTRLLQIVPTALYVHCNGHILNLCVVDLSQAVVPIRNNFGITSHTEWTSEIKKKEKNPARTEFFRSKKMNSTYACEGFKCV
ncbi:unnamed protein product [Rotaria sordida]|uniref:DUF4371 domain-containing protein n=1 Tax=Rotaria sordida TaxID=392033 RepID=A0A815CWT4_9BILA|nr:unnamed protein product [Rotaria sordida]CAF1091853.1 unnamed protein product [Rotaria sordida]CAF1287550.1 unnamed protein product [Rotaria sordida]CAF1288457.1 unnamed protein product [Rotaria sordida]